MLKKTSLCISACLSILSAQGVQQDPLARPNGLTVAFVNVDWGDCTIVIGPTGKSLIFDAGGNGKGSQKAVPMLRKLGVTRLDYAVASHYHGDHIGGLDEVINVMNPREVWDRGTRNTSRYAGSYTNYVRAAGSRRKTVRVGQVFDLGGGARARVLAYDGNVLGKGRFRIESSTNYENSASMVLRVEYGDFSMWLGGDLTGGGGRFDMETPVSSVCGDVDLYLADHHGWDDGSNANLLNNIKPEVCMISTGHNNTHNVPHRPCLDRMSSHKCNRCILSTTRGSGEVGFTTGGTMLVHSDGWRYTITAENGDVLEFYTDEFKGNAPKAGDLVISELHRNPNRYWGEFIEVFNRSGAPVNLRNLRVLTTTGSFTIATPYRVKPGSYKILAAHGDATRNGGLPFAHSWPARVLSLAPIKDDVRLHHGSTVIDRVAYDRGFAGGTDTAAERLNLEGNSNSANFSASVGRYGPKDRGTPGHKNSKGATSFPPRVGFELLPRSSHGGAALHIFASAASDVGKLGAIGMSFGTSPGIRVGSITVPLRNDELFRAVDGQVPALIRYVPSSGVRAVRIGLPVFPELRGRRIYCAHYVMKIVNRIPHLTGTSKAASFVYP